MIAAIFFIGLLGKIPTIGPSTDGPVFWGICDASAAVATDDGRILVAGDEDNLVRLYPLAGGHALASFDLSSNLATGKEIDLEGGAAAGEFVFWTGSHARTKDGKRDPDRLRFFATRWRNSALTVVGQPRADLLEAMLQSPRHVALSLREAADTSPEEGGLNIEEVLPGPRGSLYFALRSPTLRGMAIVLVLTNPVEVAIKRAEAAFAPPILLDLGGLGIRGGCALSKGSSRLESPEYRLLAGPAAGGDDYRLYAWNSADPPRQLANFRDLSPEAIVDVDGRLLVLSDDGARSIQGRRCKDLSNDPQRFRGVWIELAQSP